MKANAPKRKVFQDAVDLISPPEEAVNSVVNGQAMIPVEKIVPFHNHPFRLYEEKRLDDMVESIREHGILIPVIVQKIADGYEMLSGHNRWNAAKIVGITEIPAIIKENLTEREAYVYVIETNMLQRSFEELLPSEKAAVELSYLSEEEQGQVCMALDAHGGKINNAQAVELHKEAGSLTADKVKDILVGSTKERPVLDAKMFAQIKKKYFKGKSTDEIMGVLDQALASWFAGEGEVDV